MIPVVAVPVPTDQLQEIGAVGCVIIGLDVSGQHRIVRPGAVPEDTLDGHLLRLLITGAVGHHADKRSRCLVLH